MSLPATAAAVSAAFGIGSLIGGWLAVEQIRDGSFVVAALLAFFLSFVLTIINFF